MVFFISANGGCICKESTTCFTAVDQERSWNCCRGRMLFDELQLKFNEGKFVSTVRQRRPGLAPASLGTNYRNRKHTGAQTDTSLEIERGVYAYFPLHRIEVPSAQDSHLCCSAMSDHTSSCPCAHFQGRKWASVLLYAITAEPYCADI